MFPFCEAGMQWPSCPQPKGPGAHDSAGSIALFLGMSALGERWRSGQGGLRSIGRASFRLQHPGKVAKKKVAANYGLPNLRMSAHVRKFGDFLIIWEIIVLCFGRPSLASFATVLLVQYHLLHPHIVRCKLTFRSSVQPGLLVFLKQWASMWSTSYSLSFGSRDVDNLPAIIRVALHSISVFDVTNSICLAQY